MLLRKLAIFVVLLATSALAGASQFAYLQSASVANTASLAYGSSVSSGQILIVYNYAWGGACGTGISDTLSNTWWKMVSLLAVVGTNNNFCAWASIASSSGSDTVTITGSGAANALFVAAYSSTSSSYNIVATSFNSGGTTPTVVTSSNVVSQVSSEYMAITCFGNGHSSYTITSSPATLRQSINTITGAETASFADQDATGTFTPSSTYSNTFSGGSSDGYGVALFLVAVPSGGGGSVSNSSYAK